jgi:hypothetical protein
MYVQSVEGRLFIKYLYLCSQAVLCTSGWLIYVD